MRRWVGRTGDGTEGWKKRWKNGRVQERAREGLVWRDSEIPARFSLASIALSYSLFSPLSPALSLFVTPSCFTLSLAFRIEYRRTKYFVMVPKPRPMRYSDLELSRIKWDFESDSALQLGAALKV